MPSKTCPPTPSPREKLLARGPGALADAELLALLLRTGIAGKGVLQLAQELLDPPRWTPQVSSVAALAASPACCTPAPTT
jgi:DNA repair protein RadC